MTLEKLLYIWLKVTQYIFIRYAVVAGFAFFLFYILFRKKWQKYRIQTVFPKVKSQVLEFIHSISTMALFGIMAGLIFVIFPEQTKMYQSASEYGYTWLILSFPTMLLIHDTYFYWLHRFMHLPSVFKYVHHVHHQSTNPTPLTSYSFHFIEGLLESAILPLIAFTLPVQRETFILFFLVQFIYNVYGHLGYELYPKGFNRTWIGKWINTSVAHNMHHKFFNGNYGLYFLFWDRWMGTLDVRYDTFFNARSLEENKNE